MLGYSIGAPNVGSGGLSGCTPSLNKIKKKKTYFIDTISKVLRALRFSLSQPLQSADDSTLE